MAVFQAMDNTVIQRAAIREYLAAQLDNGRLNNHNKNTPTINRIAGLFGLNIAVVRSQLKGIVNRDISAWQARTNDASNEAANIADLPDPGPQQNGKYSFHNKFIISLSRQVY